MYHISQSPTHFSKGNLKCVLNCTKFPEKNSMVICSRQTDHQLDTNTRNLVLVLTKRGNNFTCPIFDNKLLFSSKQLKIGPGDFMFPIIHEEICDYNPRWFSSSGLILDSIIMNLFSDNTEQKYNIVQKDLFSKIKND